MVTGMAFVPVDEWVQGGEEKEAGSFGTGHYQRSLLLFIDTKTPGFHWAAIRRQPHVD